MTPAFRASLGDAQCALTDITARKQARWIPADAQTTALPPLTSHAQVTDAYLIALARSHGLRLATLDEELCRQPWAAGVAENPL